MSNGLPKKMIHRTCQVLMQYIKNIHKITDSRGCVDQQKLFLAVHVTLQACFFKIQFEIKHHYIFVCDTDEDFDACVASL